MLSPIQANWTKMQFLHKNHDVTVKKIMIGFLIVLEKQLFPQCINQIHDLVVNRLKIAKMSK